MSPLTRYTTVVCWTAATALMIAGTLDGGPEACILRAWAIFTSLIAALLTAWLLADHYTKQEDVSLERIAAVVDALHDAKRDVSRLH